MLRPLDAHAPYDTGPYRLLGGLGSGGMGTVHLAVPPDGGPGDLVALKTVRRDLELRADFRLRFRREAQAAEAVRSPYVAALVAADPDAERPWLATEYVTGPPLDEAVSRVGALPVPVVRELGADLARGLAAVHGARLVHRDLKPGNVILGSRGPRLIDFGIAQAYDATALTATGIMVGSPGFMSPEHIAGDRSVTAASDVFCLGAVLCFAATGQGPFHDVELAAVVHRIAQGRPDLSRVPGELRELIAACLAADPERRPTTTRLIRDLDPAAAHARPGVAPRPRTGPFPWPTGVTAVIGEYEAAVGRALLAPPAPQRAPDPPAASAPSDAERLPPAAATARSRRNSRLRWAGGVGAGLFVGVTAALLASLLGDGDGPGGGGAGGGGEAGGAPAGSAPRVLVSSDISDFGPDALDQSKLVSDWTPWDDSFRTDGEPRGCVLGGTTLVCRIQKESGSYALEARSAADGGFLWSYPAQDAADAGIGPAEPDLAGGYAYVSSGREEETITVLRLSDGESVATVDGAKGYTPRKTRVHGGRLFVALQRDGGSGADGTLVHAFSATGDRKRLWERRVDAMDPGSLDAADGVVHLHGRAESLSLDAENGRTLAEADERCVPVARGADYLSCPSGVREAEHMTKANGGPGGGERPLALSRDGVLLTGRNSTSDDSPAELVARDLATGRERWKSPWSGTGLVRVAGDQVIVAGEDGVHRALLAEGGGGTSATGIGSWPDPGLGGEAPPLTSMLIHGGAIYATFGDGTVLSGHVPAY